MTVPYYTDDRVTLWHGDCLDVLRTLPDSSIDAVVTDPPYGLEFMGREWDGADGFRRSLNVADTGRDSVYGRTSRTSPEYRAGSLFQAWCEQWSRECLRVLKPGGHLLAFGGTRTWHRLACAVEDAGFEIRDSIAWLYGSGFPKSLDVSKAIDKQAGAERTEVVGRRWAENRKPSIKATGIFGEQGADDGLSTAPATDAARTWQGWGTALKPAFEPIVVARKPLAGTVAANVLTHGTGALNIDGCRVGVAWDNPSAGKGSGRNTANADGPAYGKGLGGIVAQPHTAGRWPANVVLDDSQAAELDRQSGTTTSSGGAGAASGQLGYHGGGNGNVGASAGGMGHTGGASRFFPTFRYEAKAPTHERPSYEAEGASGRVITDGKVRECSTCGSRTIRSGEAEPACGHGTFEWLPGKEQPAGKVAHPTVKPLDLMRWLVRLVTPPGGTVLEPFAGSGTTAEACVIEGMRCIAIEREADYLPLIVARLSKPIELDLFGGLGA